MQQQHKDAATVREVDTRMRTDAQVFAAHSHALSTCAEYLKRLFGALYGYIKSKITLEIIDEGELVAFELLPGTSIQIPSHAIYSYELKKVLETTTLNISDIDTLGMLLLHPIREFFGERGIELIIRPVNTVSFLIIASYSEFVLYVCNSNKRYQMRPVLFYDAKVEYKVPSRHAAVNLGHSTLPALTLKKADPTPPPPVQPVIHILPDVDANKPTDESSGAKPGKEPEEKPPVEEEGKEKETNE